MRFLSSVPCRMPVSRHRSRCFHSARYRENDKGMGRGPRPRACTHFQAGFLHFAYYILHTTHYMRKAAMPRSLYVYYPITDSMLEIHLYVSSFYTCSASCGGGRISGKIGYYIGLSFPIWIYKTSFIRKHWYVQDWNSK